MSLYRVIFSLVIITSIFTHGTESLAGMMPPSGPTPTPTSSSTEYGRPPLAYQEPTSIPTTTTTTTTATTCSCTSSDGRCPMICDYSKPPDMESSCNDKCVRLANEMCTNQTMH